MNEQESPPIFVVGVPRSGTTLLAAMMGAHPRLVCGPETHFFNRLTRAKARGLCRRADWPNGAIDYLFSYQYVADWMPANFALTREEITEELARREPSIPSALSGMLDLYMRRQGKQRWVEKTPDHLRTVAQIRRYYPDSPIIRIVRDPRDVARSLMRVFWGPNTLVGALAFWRNFDEPSAPFFDADPKCHTLRYEDLVRDPESTLKDLCRAIHEPFDPRMLDTTESVRLVNAANEPWKFKVAERADPSRAEAWRKNYSANELRLVEACLGDRLRAYGYPTIDFPFSHHVEVHSLAAMEECPEVADELVASGARFWKLPGESRPQRCVFVGDPNRWLGRSRWIRRMSTARLAWNIVYYRLSGVPVAWFRSTDRADIQGHCATMLSSMLPWPISGCPISELTHPGDPA